MDLEKKIQMLEDREAIKELRATYCYLVDEGCNNNDRSKLEELMAKYFSKDATAEFQPLGKFDTYEEVHNFYTKTVPDLLSFCVHMVHNPVIKIDGNNATGEWYFDVPAIYRQTNKSVWIMGKYEEKYIKEDGVWKFLFVKANFYYFAPYTDVIEKTKRFMD